MTTAEQRREIEQVRAERHRTERLANAQPVVITGVAIPFWKLVWWLVGIGAGIGLVNAAISWLVGNAMAFFAGSPP